MASILSDLSADHSSERVRVLILGAGLSGICMGIQLRKHQIADFLILEKSSSVGGTWRENTYPGVACDVPSHLYSFSFELNPDWEHTYPAGKELQDYCENCVEKHSLNSHIKLNTEVKETVFNGKEWKIQTADGRQFYAEIVVSGLGALHIPKRLDAEGLSVFAGTRFHTAHWDRSYDLKDKRVALIGTGASAVQILPDIAREARSVKVFQRSATWVVPRSSKKITKQRRRFYRNYPWFMRLKRWWIWLLTDVSGTMMLRKNSPVHKRTVRLAKQHLHKSVQDPELRLSLTPDYSLGCKRRCVSDDYLQAFNRDNVHLVTESIARMEKDGIRDATGQLHQVDAVIEATGFQPFNISDSISVSGRDGTQLKDVWSERVTSFRTLMIPEFPNFFMLFGPNSGTGHTSALIMVESQVKYVLRCLMLMEKEDIDYLEPDPEFTKSYNQKLQRDLQKMVFQGGCNAWYTDKQDHNFTLWPYSATRFVWELARVRKSELQLTFKDTTKE